MPRTRTSARATEKDRDLARRIGLRIREARLRAGLTQQQLAGERYTKAYVSALETGIARPSMVALSYLSDRLGLPASHFMDEAHPAWTRLEVDMRLASGDWQAAADGYRALLDDTADDAMRADLLRGGRGRCAAAACCELFSRPRSSRAKSFTRRPIGVCALWSTKGLPSFTLGTTVRPSDGICRRTGTPSDSSTRPANT